MGTTAVQKANTGNTLGTLQQLLETHKQQIAVALPKHLTPERMIRIAMTAVSTTPKLQECPPVTIAAAIVQASILGLEPSSVLGEAYLVPYWNGKTQRTECQLIAGYQGLVKLARQSGEVAMIDSQVVYESDHFEFHKGSEVWWTHKWARSGDRGRPEGVWAGYVLRDGSKNFEYWSLEQIERHRAQFCKNSVDRNGNLIGAWRDAPEWMWKKTVLRQLIKLMPKSIEKPEGRALAHAVSLDERAEVGLSQQFIDVPAPLQIDDGDDGPVPTQAEEIPTPKRKSAVVVPPDPPPASPEEMEQRLADDKAEAERLLAQNNRKAAPAPTDADARQAAVAASWTEPKGAKK